MTPYGNYLVETLLTLAAVSLLATVVLYVARRAGVGRPRGPVALVGQLPLDGRRAVYLVRVGSRVLVVGASEAGLSRLGEVDAAEALAAPTDDVAGSFAGVLARVRGARRDDDASGVPS